jgi:hypothetical protein
VVQVRLEDVVGVLTTAKYDRTRLGGGMPKRRFRPRGDDDTVGGGPTGGGGSAGTGRIIAAE